MPVVKEDGTVVLALVRGDDRLELAKLAAALRADVRAATEDEIRAAFGADPGSLGPVGFQGEIVADETMRQGQFVAGANRTGRHLRGVEHGRDFEARFADLRVPAEGDRCVNCGGALRFQTAIEVGHIFKLGTRYSVPLDATFLDEDGQERPLVMGSYGIGPGRIMAAAVEQLHDEHGIRWPAAIAPYDVHVVVLPGVEEQASRSRRGARRGGCRRPARRPRAPRRREVRRRRPDRPAEARYRGQEDARGRNGGCTRPHHRERATCQRCGIGQGGLRWQSDGGSALSRSERRSSG